MTSAETANGLSKKYASLYPPLVARILGEERLKHSEAAALKSAKARLHRLYGAYIQANANKKTAMLLDAWDIKEQESFTDAVLRLHASTRERRTRYAQLYRFIFTHAPPCTSVLDLGCGYNPFALPYLKPYAPGLGVIHALDICSAQAALLNRFFALHTLPAAAACADLAAPPGCGPEVHPCLQPCSSYPEADIAFAFKLLPVLEAQCPGSGFALLRSLRVKHLAVTYPIKSLGGKEKGMARTYRHTFETALDAGRLAPFTLRAEMTIGSEWVCVLGSGL